MENYILEAFQKLRLIEDDFDLSADRDVVDELKSFVADDIEEIPDEPIIDVTAEDEEDLSDNYIGKVILECTCCHSRIYKDEADVVIDEDSELANIDEECPVCGTAMGYTVIGKIEKFDDDVDFEDADEEGEEVELEPEDNPAEEEPVESLRDRIAKKRLQESPEKYNFNKKDKLEIADKEILTWGEASRGTDYQYDTDKLLLKVCTDVCKELGWDLRNWDFYTSGGTLQVMPLPDKTPSQKRKIRQAFENTCRELYGDDFVVKSNTVTHYGPYDQDGRTFEYTKVGVTPVQVSMSLLNQYPLSFKNESLAEGIENISVDTEDTHLEMSTKEDGGVEIETTPLTEDEFELTDDTESEVEEPEAEEIVPLTDEEQADILDNKEETLDDIEAEADMEELPAEDEEELPIPDEFEETEKEEEEEEIPEESLKSKGNSVNEGADEEDDEEGSDIDDFDECAFNDLVESYLRRVYENVNTFKTTGIKDSGDTILVEGIIKFKNNKAMKSSFVFTEATETKTGKVVLEGYNTTFSKAPKSFRVRGSLKNNNYVSESLSYNYTARNLTEGKINRTKVCGRVKR